MTFAVAIVYPNIMSIFGIVGGVFSSAIGLIVPFLIKIRMNENEGKKWWCVSSLFHAGLIVGLVFIGAGSTYVSIFGAN